jgi:hypothetical protein
MSKIVTSDKHSILEGKVRGKVHPGTGHEGPEGE